MPNVDNMSNKTLVAEQYKNTDNLTLRQGLHEKYSVNKIGLVRWMFDQYPFRAGGGKVLELGSGIDAAICTWCKSHRQLI